MTPADVNAYFTPLDYIMYLGAILVIMTAYYQWKWAKTCNRFVQVIIVRSDGKGDYVLVPKEGGSISLKDPGSDTVRLWPINELCTIDLPYPGSGPIPSFLQKQIRTVVVDEKDWEPMINRSPHLTGIMSPDVVADLTVLAERMDDGVLKDRLEELLDQASTGPTREMIASPAVLGNLIVEKITEAVLTVNKEVLDAMSGFVKRLDKMVSPTMFFIGIGVIIVMQIFLIYQFMPALEALGSIEDIANDIVKLKSSLGVP